MVRFLKLDVRPKYWDDSMLNGSFDISLKEQNKRRKPRMPFTYYSVGNNEGEYYKISFIIDLYEGSILGWPDDTLANIFYEVSDMGKYSLIDEKNEVICEYTGTVPKLLDTTGESRGEFIELGPIHNSGQIANWHNNINMLKYINEFLKEHFE